jgi:hypothetical protein
MNARTPTYMQPIDVHEALAHAHAERGEFLAAVFIGVATLVKRAVAAIRPHREHLPHKGACA